MLGSLLPARRTRDVPEVVERNFPSMSWEAFQTLFKFNGNQYLTSQFRSAGGKELLGACGPAYTVLDRRVSIIAEARPTWQRFSGGVPSGMFSTSELEILKVPWPGGSWRLLVAIAESDVAAAGNSYWIRPTRDLLVRIDPDWVTIVTEAVDAPGTDGSRVPVGSRLLGYVVQQPGMKPAIFEPGELAHYRPGAPIGCPWRGESWLASVALEASSDLELTRYKGNYLKNGAMPSLAVMYEPTIDKDALEAFVEMFADKFVGSMNAGKVMHFLGGRDVKTVGATLDQLSFKAVQGAGETRIAAAAGVPASVAGFSEGMQGSSLNAGNYTATRRLFGDAKIRPLLGSFMDAFSTLVRPPSDARLFYDDSQVSFFQEDVKDEAEIRTATATTIDVLIKAGFEPDAAIAAGTTGNFNALIGQHTGLTSVQLQPPTDGTTPST